MSVENTAARILNVWRKYSARTSLLERKTKCRKFVCQLKILCKAFLILKENTIQKIVDFETMYILWKLFLLSAEN